MNVEITEFEKRFCFELCPVTQLCGQNEIEIMFQIINDQVNKVGDIEISYAMSDVWDMVQKSEVSGIDDTELSDKSNAGLILILLNIVDNVLENNPKKTLILFESERIY